jgi:hypothetical protein
LYGTRDTNSSHPPRGLLVPPRRGVPRPWMMLVPLMRVRAAISVNDLEEVAAKLDLLYSSVFPLDRR